MRSERPSTFFCTPNALSQEVGTALGAHAGEARIRQVAIQGGFTQFRRTDETPVNLVFEARHWGSRNNNPNVA